MLTRRTEAILLAVVHYLMFSFLDGKAAEGKERIARQSYVSTARIFLRMDLGRF